MVNRNVVAEVLALALITGDGVAAAADLGTGLPR